MMFLAKIKRTFVKDVFLQKKNRKHSFVKCVFLQKQKAPLCQRGVFVKLQQKTPFCQIYIFEMEPNQKNTVQTRQIKTHLNSITSANSLA